MCAPCPAKAKACPVPSDGGCDAGAAELGGELSSDPQLCGCISAPLCPADPGLAVKKASGSSEASAACQL